MPSTQLKTNKSTLCMPTLSIPKRAGAFRMEVSWLLQLRRITHWFAGIHTSRAQQCMKRTHRAGIKVTG